MKSHLDCIEMRELSQILEYRRLDPANAGGEKGSSGFGLNGS